MIWKNTTVSIFMVTLSFVITGCGAKSTTCSFKRTRFATRSINGILKWTPTFHVSRYAPSLSTTIACACGTMRIQETKISRMMKISTNTNNAGIFIPPFFHWGIIMIPFLSQNARISPTVLMFSGSITVQHPHSYLGHSYFSVSGIGSTISFTPRTSLIRT